MAKIVGILNITPDSFSDGGQYLTKENILKRIAELKESQTDLIDLGAQATGPSSTMLSLETELGRIKEVLNDNDILAALNSIGFSVDTYHSSIAHFALKKGAKIINDISAMRYDQKMLSVIKEFNSQVILMYSKETASHPHASMRAVTYLDIIKSIKDFFNERIEYALKGGLSFEQIILDPGMGKFISLESKISLELIERFQELKSHFPDFRFLLGVSRKGFIKNLYPDKALDQASKELEIKLIKKSVDYIRTHDAKLLTELLKQEVHV